MIIISFCSNVRRQTERERERERDERPSQDGKRSQGERGPAIKQQEAGPLAARQVDKVAAAFACVTEVDRRHAWMRPDCLSLSRLNERRSNASLRRQSPSVGCGTLLRRRLAWIPVRLSLLSLSLASEKCFAQKTPASLYLLAHKRSSAGEEAQYFTRVPRLSTAF